MKPLKQVAQAYMALSEGEKRLKEEAFEEAVAEYRKAMDVTRTIPEEEVFDHDGFDALCHAGLSGAFAKLGRYDECLLSADNALHYFNRRGELHQDEGKLWIAAVVNRAVGLAGTGRSSDALKAFRMADEMVAERKGEIDDKERLQKMIADNIAMLQTSMPEDTAKRKAWWEFWS
ncbi:MAG: tetratricopeptide repeat protein [Chlorobium phaeobacteroides]|uniref:DUF3856 domain-containing protein n=1 Tax=Chlorobium phaeobacteroides (strain BS1) TaxID=331678 RepID=B3EKF6_CHLPB|nr:tetratricopeptide repeat protein [Chlorobium phaeobacteroides]MBL6956546.1 tetratricopeptide repeat protein [Chlorobium phaeobacteroides]